MTSGVKVADSVVDAYNKLKLKKNCRYMIMHIDDGLIQVLSYKERDQAKDQADEFNEFVAQLPNDCGRYCLVDLSVPQKNGALKDILFLITWCPEGANAKSHIMYTTSKRALTEKIHEGTTDIQANDLSDLDYQDFLAKGCK